MFERAVTEAAKLYLRHQNKDKKSLVIDIDASYRESKTSWCSWDYKGDHSFRIMFTHASKEKRGAKAILKVSVDPGNTSPQKDLPEIVEELAEDKTAEELRQLYELRGGQEASISQFKQMYEVKAKESREKTEVWVRLLALAYNLSLHFMRGYAQKKTLTLPDIFTPAYRLFPGGL